jgi:prolipoprotein diacylglyceryltransferase
VLALGAPQFHPTQLYESALLFLFYAFLMWVYRRKKFDGQIFASYLMGYAILRAARFTSSAAVCAGIGVNESSPYS